MIGKNGLKIVKLLVEYLENPLGIDDEQPRLSWIVFSGKRSCFQAAYRVIAATGEDILRNDEGDVWDSGIVSSEMTVNIVYSGCKLQSGTRYYWKIRIWDMEGNDSGWSETAWWEMGLLSASDWKAQWIGADHTQIGSCAPLIRKEFFLDKPIKTARAYICGLGYYELYINGKKTGDHVLDPGFTNYDQSILYVTYDITGFLSTGTNAVGVELGRSFYGLRDENVWNWEKTSWNSDPKVLLQLNIQFTDDTRLCIGSDDIWKYCAGPTLSDSIYCGEIYDAREEKQGWHISGFDDSGWLDVQMRLPPRGSLKAQIQQPIKVMETTLPEKITNPVQGIYVCHFERNISGWVKLSLSGNAGTEVTLRYGEKLTADGRVSMENELVSKPTQRDVYLLKGEGIECWEPKFSYKGFQYVEIGGYPGTPSLKDIEARIVHSAVDDTGSFNCSNGLFNKIHQNSRTTILSNLHSIPTDTPVYEKNGWMGDAHLISETAILNFNMSRFYEKWVGDMEDCLTEEGVMPLIVPNGVWGLMHAPEWTAAYILIPWYLYWYYEDKRVLEEQYEGMKKYAEYEILQMKDYLSSSCLGDWLAPGTLPEALPPEGAELTSTAFMYLIIRMMTDIANVLGNQIDAERYGAFCSNIQKAFNAAFLNAGESVYCTGIPAGYRQTSNIIPAAFGLIPLENVEGIIDHLIQDIIDKGGHLDTGIVGTKYLLSVLTEYGKGEIAYRIVNQTTFPGWGYWIENGATTNWEAWEAEGRSRNHYAFGTVDEWFYKYLAGIRAESSGYKRIRIKPHVLDGLDYVEAQQETVRGTISVCWFREKNNFLRLNIVVPANTTATVYVPSEERNTILETGASAEQAEGVKFLRMEDGYAVYCVGSGRYSFTSKLKLGADFEIM